MLTSWRRQLDTALLNWVKLVERFNLPVVVVIFGIAGACLYYAGTHFRMNTDTSDMLSSELAWRQQDRLYDKYFPQYTDNILIVVEASTPDQSIDAANTLHASLTEKDDLFKSVYYPEGLPFFRQSALLYLDPDELQDLADNLATIQPFLGQLTRDQSVRGLLAMLEKALDARSEGEDVDIQPLLERMTTTIQAVNQNEFHRLSWHSLMQGDTPDKETYRQFILLQPILDYDGLLPGKAAIESIRETVAQTDLESRYGVDVRLTGSTALAYEEILSVSRGTGYAVLAALAIVIVILLMGLRSVWLMAASILTLLAGLSITAAFAIATVKELNLISIAFAVLYIGLGIDFAIHYCLRYRELLLQPLENKLALQSTAVNIGKSLVLCATTTAVGFFAFLPTDYDGVAELGWISGSGMFISLFVTLTLLPALLTLSPCHPERRRRQEHPARRWLLELPSRSPRTVLLVTLVLAVGSCISLLNLRFDPNTLNLQPQQNESVKTYIDLLKDSDTSPWTGILLADSAADAGTYKQKLEALDAVDRVVWLQDFIPEGQQGKLFTIDEMNLLFGLLPVDNDTTTISPGATINALENFHDTLKTTRGMDKATQGKLVQVVDTLITDLRTMDETGKTRTLQRLHDSLLASFPGRVEALHQSLQATEVDSDNLPATLKSRWLGDDDHYRLAIYPAKDLMNNVAMRDFVRAVQNIAPQVIGPPVINIEAGDAVIKAFREAFTYAVITICLILLLLLRRKRDVLLILTPLLLAALFTGALSVLASIPMNFANIIALPLLLGIGVDSGIHIMHRYRHAPPDSGHILETSSARAVIVSALTTIFSIGNLALSPHPGTASMGVLLTLGISMVLICTLLVLPALIATFDKRQ